MARVRYILEIRRGKKSEKFLLPLVSDIKFQRKHAKVAVWTLGKIPAKHYAGVRGQTITMSGRSGLKPRFETIGATSVPAADQSGPALFRRLETFLEAYENEAAAAQRHLKPPPQLIFRALWEGKNLFVDHMSFQWSRSAKTSRFSYEWDLELDAYAEAEDFYERGSMFKAVTDAIEKVKLVSTAINATSIAVQYGTELLEDGKTLLDGFREPLRALRRLASQTRTFSRTANDITRWPKAFMLDFWFTLSEMTTAIFDSWAALPFVDRQAVRSTMIDAMEVIGTARTATQAALGLNFVSLPGRLSTYESQTGGGTSTDPKYTTRERAITSMEYVPGSISVLNGQLVTAHEVIAGETLPDIAERYLEDRGYWVDIATLNGMTSIDTVAAGGPLLGGLILFVPVADGAQLPGLNPQDLYGVDMRLGPDGDLLLLGNPKDVQTVSGVDNLRQGLTNRFLTTQGDNATFPNHGLPLLVGEGGTEDRVANAAIEAEAQLRAEQRVAKITDLSIVDDGDSLLLTSTVEPVVGKAFDIAVPFPA